MSAAVWHDVECGAYADDLPVWEELAAASTGPVLELGCGTGRVLLHLAKRGHEVTGIDTNCELVAALNERAERSGLDARATVADATGFDLGRRFAVVIAPMQVAQVLGGSAQRRAMLACASAHLVPGGRFAAAIVASAHLSPSHPVNGDAPAPPPDVREVDGWMYSSLPLSVAPADGGRFAIERLRQTVSPQGELSEEVDITMLDPLSPTELANEAAAAGLRSAGTREIAASELYIGSTVCLLERE